MNLKDYIRSIPDYPKKGILFRDITTLIKDENAFEETINQIVERSKKFNFTKIAAIESRGFAFASAAVYGINFEYSLIIGGTILLISGFFDIVAGQVARFAKKITKKGGFMDSIFDKIAEVAIFFGILIGNYADPYLVIIAITLSLLVSYMRAKADSMNIKLQGVGIGERAERLLVIAIIGMIGFMDAAVVIVIIIAAITLGQRLVAISKNR